MLRIAVVTRYFPSSGEPWQGRSAYKTLRELAGTAKVHVFYPDPNYPSFLSPRSRIYDKLNPSYRIPGVDVSYVGYPAVPLISRPLNGRMEASVLLSHVREFAPDVILGVFLYPEGYAALKLGKKLGVPVVEMGIGSDIHSIGDRWTAMHTRKVLREANYLVTVSEDLRQKALGIGASAQRSCAIVNGCDPAVFHPADRVEVRHRLGLNVESPMILYIGRTDLRKGLLELVEAAARLHQRRPEAQVYMVGDGPDRTQVLNAIEASGAGEYVHPLPACAPDETALWMAASDLVTLPSYMEGCPNVVLEALSCGRPVVATRVGGIPEIMSDDCGALIAPHNVPALEAALDAVLAKQWDAETIAARWSRKWSTVAAELNAVLQLVVRSSM